MTLIDLISFIRVGASGVIIAFDANQKVRAATVSWPLWRDVYNRRRLYAPIVSRRRPRVPGRGTSLCEIARASLCWWSCAASRPTCVCAIVPRSKYRACPTGPCLRNRTTISRSRSSSSLEGLLSTATTHSPATCWSACTNQHRRPPAISNDRAVIEV